MSEAAIFVAGVAVFIATATTTLIFGYLRFGELYGDRDS